MIDKLINIFYRVARKENDELRKLYNWGIFYVPELAYVHLCCKEVIKSGILETNEYVLVKEKKYPKYGLADLVFEPKKDNNPEIVIEFKMDKGWDVYLKDIEKLERLKGSDFNKYFCAMKWINVEADSDKFLGLCMDNFGSKARRQAS